MSSVSSVKKTNCGLILKTGPLQKPADISSIGLHPYKDFNKQTLLVSILPRHIETYHMLSAPLHSLQLLHKTGPELTEGNESEQGWGGEENASSLQAMREPRCESIKQWACSVTPSSSLMAQNCNFCSRVSTENRVGMRGSLPALEGLPTCVSPWTPPLLLPIHAAWKTVLPFWVFLHPPSLFFWLVNQAACILVLAQHFRPL